jgi:hypothetical protein
LIEIGQTARAIIGNGSTLRIQVGFLKIVDDQGDRQATCAHTGDGITGPSLSAIR